MNHFCTLFDSNYLDRGLVMYKSLIDTGADFHLYIFPFDDRAHDILRTLNLPKVTLISLSEFENPNLLGVKPGRTRAEYCWTCTSHTIDYVLSRFNIPQCTYLDADLCFYQDPAVLLNEMGDASVLITEHRYTPEYDQSATSGIYCVQFLSIRNSADGRTALSWWRDRCLEWCYNRMEDGKFGDQKYLDDWTTRFRGVHVLQHLGGGVAPWNIQQYELSRGAKGHWMVRAPRGGQVVPLVFYHFHYVKYLAGNRVDLSPYRLEMKNVYSLYADYLRQLRAAQELTGIIPSLGVIEQSWRALIWTWRRRWNGTYNVFDRTEFNAQWPG